MGAARARCARRRRDGGPRADRTARGLSRLRRHARACGRAECGRRPVEPRLPRGRGLGPLGAARSRAPLAIVGVASVLWWFFTGRTGIGDLRPYLLLQVAPLLLVPAWQALAGSPRPERIAFGVVIALYAAAKAAELGDRTIFEALGFMSGHTAKHLLATAACAVLVASIAGKSRSTRA